MKILPLLAIASILASSLSAADISLLSGSSRKSFSTIQSAIDAAKPGDTIELGDGIYHEFVRFPRSGKSGKPITLQGREGTRPVLDGADPVLQQVPNSRWTPIEHLGRTFYAAEVPFESSQPGLAIATWVSRDGDPGTNGCDKLIAAYAGLDALSAAPRGEGSFRKGNTVTVNLAESADPNKVALNVGRCEAIIDLGSQSHIRLRNLELRNSGWAGIIAGTSSTNAELDGTAELDTAALPSQSDCSGIEINDIIIRNCFRGITTGTQGMRGLDIRRVIVANGTRDDWPWAGGYQSGVGQAAGNNSDGLAPWRGFGIRLMNVKDSSVSECLISGQWDGMGLKKCNGVSIHNNTLRDLMDDGIEMESADQSNIRFFNNHIYHTFAGVSVTSNFPGPIFVYRNVVEVSHPGGRHFNPSYTIKSGHDSLARAENVKFYQNTFYGPSFNLWEKLGDEAPDRWHGYDFVNNVFFSRKENFNFRGAGLDDDGGDNHWEANAYSTSKPNEKDALTITELDTQFENSQSPDPHVPRNLRLKPGSPALDSGSNYASAQGWPESVTDFPGGRNRGAWEDGMAPDAIGAPASVLKAVSQ